MADGQILHGQEYDVRTDRLYRYTKRVKAYDGPKTARITGLEGTAKVDQSPIDEAAAECRTYDASAFLTAEQAKTPLALPTKLALGERLPPVLNSITVTFNKSGGTGTSDHLASDMLLAIANAGSGSLDPKSTAQASASIVPAVSWSIDTWHQDVIINATVYKFVDAPGMSITAIIARLFAQNTLTVLDLPVYKKKSIQLILKGSQVSLQQSADSTVGISINTAADPQTSTLSKSKGSSSSTETGVTIRIETTPFCIYNALSLSSNTDSQAVTVTVKANTPAGTTAASSLTSVTNEPTALTGTAAGSVIFSPSGTGPISTTPATIDTTKKYITDIQTREEVLGTVEYNITVVDFVQYA